MARAPRIRASYRNLDMGFGQSLGEFAARIEQREAERKREETAREREEAALEQSRLQGRATDLLEETRLRDDYRDADAGEKRRILREALEPLQTGADAYSPKVGADFKVWAAGERDRYVNPVQREERAAALRQKIAESTRRAEQIDTQLADLPKDLASRDAKTADAAFRRMGELFAEKEFLVRERLGDGDTATGALADLDAERREMPLQAAIYAAVQSKDPRALEDLQRRAYNETDWMAGKGERRFSQGIGPERLTEMFEAGLDDLAKRMSLDEQIQSASLVAEDRKARDGSTELARELFAQGEDGTYRVSYGDAIKRVTSDVRFLSGDEHFVELERRLRASRGASHKLSQDAFKRERKRVEELTERQKASRRRDLNEMVTTPGIPVSAQLKMVQSHPMYRAGDKEVVALYDRIASDAKTMRDTLEREADEALETDPGAVGFVDDTLAALEGASTVHEVNRLTGKIDAEYHAGNLSKAQHEQLTAQATARRRTEEHLLQTLGGVERRNKEMLSPVWQRLEQKTGFVNGMPFGQSAKAEHRDMYLEIRSVLEPALLSRGPVPNGLDEALYEWLEPMWDAHVAAPSGRGEEVLPGAPSPVDAAKRLAAMWQARGPEGIGGMTDLELYTTLMPEASGMVVPDDEGGVDETQSRMRMMNHYLLRTGSTEAAVRMAAKAQTIYLDQPRRLFRYLQANATVRGMLEGE